MQNKSLLELVGELKKLERKQLSGVALTRTETEKLAELRKFIAITLHGVKESDDRRELLRVPVNLRVRYASGEVFAHNYIQNLSSGGVFIPTDRPLPLDTTVHLIIYFEDKKTEVTLEGKVVWENLDKSKGMTDKKEQGMGIKFVKIPDEAKPIIHDIVHDILENHAKERESLKESEKTKQQMKEAEKRTRGFFGRKKS